MIYKHDPGVTMKELENVIPHSPFQIACHLKFLYED